MSNLLESRITLSCKAALWALRMAASLTVSTILILTSIGRHCFLILLLAWSAAAVGDELRYTVSGVDDALRQNVLGHIETLQLGRKARLAEKDYAEVIANTSRRAREALRPFGYYRPDVSARIERKSESEVVLSLAIKPGPPMIVAAAHIQVIGDGVNVKELQEWQKDWPLQSGSRLNQSKWEEAKQHAIEIANTWGFRAAKFTEHAIELDLVENRATLRLTFDTGPQYMFGDIDFGEHMLKPGIVEFIPRFQKGEPFRERLLEKFRVDLWKTGYFTNIDVVEVDQPDESPPEVDLKISLETSHKNSYQGSVGMGTDTGVRVQAQWSRHPMSRNGDRVDVGVGWQEADDEFSLKSNYRLPRISRAREYWTAEIYAKYENLDLEFKRRPEDEEFVNIANGSVTELNMRAGRLKIRNLKEGNRQLFDTLFVQFLNSTREYNPVFAVPPELSNPEFDRLLKGTDNATSIGVDVNLVDVRGKGFDTVGRRDHAWLFSSVMSIGSDMNFTQAFIGTRRIYRKGERWKFLLRAELGYTDATVDKFDFVFNNQSVNLSVTRLPNFYRFKAGGSNSVRGYGFESLSNNDVGSNHIATASAEAEMKVLEKWSVAAFADIGNAFNEWSDPNLYRGVGFGVRWYSIAGPISVDFAKALDLTGKPWRIHFTIGVSLL